MYEFQCLKTIDSGLRKGNLDSYGNYISSNPSHDFERTYAYVIWHSPLADDILGESNYHAIVTVLSEIDPDRVYWCESSVNHWTYSYYNTINVQLYDEDGKPTPVAIEADKILCALSDYPVLDEEDYSEREYKALCIGLVDWYGVPDDKVSEIFSYLSDTCSVCRLDEVNQKMIDIALSECGVEIE